MKDQQLNTLLEMPIGGWIDNYSRLGYDQQLIERVPGGWNYHYIVTDYDNKTTTVAVCFVPEPSTQKHKQQ